MKTAYEEMKMELDRSAAEPDAFGESARLL